MGKAEGEKTEHWSYFGSNGWLKVNQTIIINGKKYKADGRGWLTELKVTLTASQQNAIKKQKIILYFMPPCRRHAKRFSASLHC